MKAIEARDTNKPKNRQLSMLHPMTSKHFGNHRQSNFTVNDGNFQQKLRGNYDGNATNNTKSSKEFSEDESSLDSEDYE